MMPRSMVLFTFFIAIIAADLQAQAVIRPLYNRVMYFDQNGLTDQSPVQLMEDLPALSRSWNAKHQAYYGGRFYAAYRAWPNDSTRVIYLRTSGDGINWSDRIQVSDAPPGIQNRYPNMTVGGNPQQPDICITWQDNRFTNRQLRAAVSSDGGQTFGPSVEISDHSNSEFIQSDIARDADGNLYVAWTRQTYSNSFYTTWFSRSLDGGLSWTPRQSIHTGRIYSYPSQIVARGSGELLIGIADDQNSRLNLVTYASSDSGATWQPRTQATNYGFSQGFRFYSLLADANDNIHFFHAFLQSNQIQDMRHLRSSDWGVNWSTPVVASDPASSPIDYDPSVTSIPTMKITPQGIIYAAYADRRLDPGGNNYEIRITRSQDGGQSWDPEIVVNDLPQIEEQFYPVMAIAPGAIDTVSLVWSEVRPVAAAPSAFNLLDPADNSTLTGFDAVDFRWRQAVDPNGDPVSYSLNITEVGGAASDTLVGGISDTSLVFNGQGFFRSAGDYRWSVTASDGQFSTASDTFTFQTPASQFSVMLEAPADSDTLTSLSDPLTFRWHPEVIFANGPLSYSLRLFGSAGDTTIAGLADTAFVFQGGAFFSNNHSYRWTVLADDGLLSVSADTFTIVMPQGAMSGICTIGSEGDFATFSDAVAVLQSFGVSGPLTFRVLQGSYNEKFRIRSFSGQGAANPVVFEAANGDPNSVNIRYMQQSDDFQMIRLDTVSHVTFRNLTFTIQENSSNRHNGIYIAAGNAVTIENCTFLGPNVKGINGRNSSLTAWRSEGLTIRNNEFQRNGYAIRLQGGNDSTLTAGIDVEGNTIDNPLQTAIFCIYLDAPQIRQNTIQQGADRLAVYINRCYNNFRINGNRIFMSAPAATDQDIWGLLLWFCNGNTARGLVSNNIIHARAEDSTIVAVAAESWASENVDVYYNTLHVSNFKKESGAAGNAIALNLFGGNGFRVYNNSMSIGSQGWAYNVNSPINIESDFNNIYSADRTLARWGSYTVGLLADLQTVSGMDLNSVSASPCFYSASDLHSNAAALDSAANPVATILEDIDGDLRHPQYPDIGADEFTPQNIGMAGSYSIGAGEEFNGFRQALEAIHTFCLMGPVTFNIKPGIYNEWLYIKEIPGAAVNRRVVFQSQTGRPEDVVLSYDNSPGNYFYVISFDGADYITFRNITIEGRPGRSSRAVIDIRRDAKNLQFTGNHIRSAAGAEDGMLFHVFQEPDVIPDGLLIKNNRFENGYVRIFSQSNSTPISDFRFEGNHLIAGGDFTFAAISLSNLSAPVVQFNRIEVSTSESIPSHSALLLTNCNDGLQVLGNDIRMSGTRDVNGLIISNSNGNGGLVANNFITVNGDSLQTGLLLFNSTLDIFYNSLEIRGGNGQLQDNFNRAFSAEEGEYRVVNNIFAGSSGGYAWFVAPNTVISQADYNDLYTTGPILANYNDNDLRDLDALRSASGRHANSISVRPNFASSSDLHLRGPGALAGAGTPLSEVVSDIDRQRRSTTTPDIGADEYSGRRIIIRRKNGLNLSLEPGETLRDDLRINLFPGQLQDGYVLADVKVMIDTLRYGPVSDLDLMLVHNGIVDTLVFGLISNGNDFLNTVFDDSAAQGIEQGAPPFSGSFRPFGALAVFNGIDPVGDWQLQVRNRGIDSSGVLQAWGLELGFEFITAIDDDEAPAEIPLSFGLGQNYPNPFNPETVISYSLSVNRFTTLKVYDVLGREVRTLVKRDEQPGEYAITWDGRDDDGNPVTSGIYIYRLTAGDFVKTRKMVLIR